jgi:hypothetical protein
MSEEEWDKVSFALFVVHGADKSSAGPLMSKSRRLCLRRRKKRSMGIRMAGI